MEEAKKIGKVSFHEIRTNGRTPPVLTQAGAPPLSTLEDIHSLDEKSVYYDRGAAKALAEIASWAYANCEVLLDELHHRQIVGQGATCKQVSVANEAMLVVATAFFIRDGDVGVICFRGTEPNNAINFLTDASCRALDLLSMGRVHGGFYRNVRAVWSELEDHINGELAGPQPLKALYITGHSLGAAMAVIAAAIIFGSDECSPWRSLVRGVYTYGQPMVGDKEFAKSCERFEKILFRHVYGKDLVTRLPPLSTGRFEHFGIEYHGSDEGWTPRSDVSTQVVSVAVSIPIGIAAWAVRQIPLLGWVRLPLSIDDHSPNSYLQAFRAASQ